MRIKRQSGDELVHLGPKHQACPEELIRQRCGHNGCTEYLIRWNIVCLDNGKGNSVEATSAEGKKQTILMWMSAEDIYANCPTLLGKRKPKEQVVEQNVSNLFPPEDTLDEASLAEMKADVRNLVQRASWQLASTPVPQSSILNTIHILSAYASIGSLMTMFKETGALTLLMKMLCNEEKHIRCSAGKMLRALACHDAGSRAYVLLSLSQQDGIEQQMDFDSRYTLLELFAETTSSEEHYISFEGIPLPQIPGKLLFSLVKRYLCATSLMDKLNITEWGDEQEHCMPSSADSKRKKRTQCEFDFSMAMAHFISELIQVMGWNQNQELCSLRQKKRCQSIFQPKIPACVTIPSAAEVPQKEHSAFKLHSAFPSRKDYVEYLREKLVRGMHVRMLENYEKVSAGDEGKFLHSNNGTPPVQVYWESLGRTYWVHWHMIEIVGSSRNAEQKAQEKGSTLRELLRQNTVNQSRYCQPLNELYSLPCLTDHLNKDCGTLSQAEWWELLFFINKLEFHKHHEVVHFIQQNQKLSRLNEEDLIQMCVSVELAQKILQLLNKHCQGTTQIELQNSHVYFKYFFSKGGTEQNCTNAEMLSANYDDDLSEAMKSKETKEGTLPDRVSSPAPFAVKESDRRLINKFLKIKGLSFPDTLDEKVKDSAAFFNLNITKLLSSLQTNSVWKEMAMVLQCCLSDKGTIFEETSHEFLVNVLIQKDLTQQESEKEIQLGMLRLLNKCLDSSWKDVVPWHKCIEPCLSSINSHINDQEIVQEFIKFLHRLAFDNKDCAVVMCSSSIQEALSKVVEKHSSSLSLVTELRDLMNNCEKPASLYQKMTASILAGCIQMVLNQIEEHRNSHQPIRVPFFDVFLHYLCHGCSTEVKEDKCWEKVEVSSNSQQANKLVDGNVKTYWESNGTTGSHYINVYMHHGVLIQQMSLLVASEDSSYMPARIIVMAGESTSSINTKLSMVNVPPLSTRVILLENMTHFWPIIQIKIKHCQQVKQFLKSSWQAPDFVERYCGIYKHLCTAMEELFGQKMSFLLALSDGFSESLVQLPFFSAVHVSEKFAQYIDLWIRDSWTDSTNIEKVQHLQQSLEPISFLAELELANIFEHFYRYYLGERLLSLGNTWLESAVVEQIGLCFPSRYPQQMLKNLSELEQQEQEFHLFQLQQLDKHFLEVDQQGRLKEEEEGEVMQEKSFLQEEETEVKVLLLSPFCWTIPPLCYLKDPIRFFPPSLSQHLSKFADFYIQSQSCFGLAHTKSPRLEWTWLGHAELGYQGCILQVSTLQMYILLCFNSAQEVSVETLLEVTGLSPVFLGHALKPLIKENGILTQRQSILRLNEEVLGHVSDQRLCLLPKTVYLNAEEKVCHALEKKKNFICCLLNQILKEEKEIHIDSLVFKVIEACHKQRCASPSDFLGNVCSSADVLSCILYLLNQGFVQRQENFPQLLQYVCVDIPTPALPKNQPQVVFQTVQIKKVPSTPCMEKKQTFSTFR
ncbi:cullin-9-like isoform X4 [Crotalus tigris]|uniref:cullin-9-like isoform X4 n=1 Tax=Crotalus tigris TaxID=88082 RepID=UPI00192F26C1|nr:cullin-9-like isoform X4 [Crotalus tigris]